MCIPIILQFSFLHIANSRAPDDKSHSHFSVSRLDSYFKFLKMATGCSGEYVWTILNTHQTMRSCRISHIFAIDQCVDTPSKNMNETKLWSHHPISHSSSALFHHYLFKDVIILHHTFTLRFRLMWANEILYALL